MTLEHLGFRFLVNLNPGFAGAKWCDPLMLHLYPDWVDCTDMTYGQLSNFLTELTK